MTGMRWLIAESADRIFREQCDKTCVDDAESGTWPQPLWDTLEEAGLTVAAVPEACGGAGGALGDAMTVLREAGRYAAPLPLAETTLAGWLLSRSGATVPSGPLTVAPVAAGEPLELRRTGHGWTLSGSARQIPFAHQSARLVVFASAQNQPRIALVNPQDCHLRPAKSLAGEPRDDVAFDGVELAEENVIPAGDGVDLVALQRLGALTRAVMMAGALDTVLTLTVRHTSDRVQFGRPIGKFQAVRQQIAVLGGEVAAAGRAADDAVFAAETGGAAVQIAAAKVRVGEAAGVCAEISHQLHGAIGFTYEHALHQFTRRLWSWRDEFGPEAHWALELGRRLTGSPEDVWAFLADARLSTPEQ